LSQNHSRKVVIVGGGVIGLGIAWHLSRMGETDVLLVERNPISSGTSWHAAGIVGPLRASMNMTRLAAYATELFPQLEQLTGQASGYQRTGGYWLAQQPERMQELRRIYDLSLLTGIEARLMTAGEVGEREPYLNTTNLSGALMVATDAQASPVDICNAYARGARQDGVEIREQTSCIAIHSKAGRVSSVELSDGSHIQCEAVVNCAGAWAPMVGALAGVPVALQAVQHMYVVTEPVAELPKPFPILRDLDNGIYIKGDAGKLVLGGFEPHAKLWDPAGQDGDRAFLELPEDWDQFEPFMQAGLERVPLLNECGIQHFMNGPESFTPDSKPLLGESPYLGGFYIAAGLNSTGMMSSAGIGKAMAEWIVAGEAPFDLWEVDVARFDQTASATPYVQERMQEAVSDVFAMHWPFKLPTAGRQLRCLALHDEWLEQGAVMGCPAGWERPLWFADNETEKQFDYSFNEQCWWPYAERETRQLTEATVLFDLSPFSKINVTGPDALELLQWLCANDIDVAVGTTVYTQMLNTQGGIEADITISRLAEDSFRLTGGAPTRWRDLARLRRSAHHSNLQITDVTEDECVLGMMGPGSRTILQQLCEQDVSTDGLLFACFETIEIAGVEVTATRMSFVGELGFELSIPTKSVVDVYTAIKQIDTNAELLLAGLFCLESARLEKAFRHWGHDIGPFDTPLEAGLSFAVCWDKVGGFQGRDALLKQRQQGVDRTLLLFEVCVTENPKPLLLHDEPVFKNGQLSGHTTSGGQGYRTGKSLCFAYIKHAPGVTKPALLKDTYEIQVAGQRYALQPLARAPFDPNNTRMMG
jgi:glycine cleavage system aminomethyltransferase T/glycine/D-amino acid oxidase-like deaminating enzyme